MSCCPRSKEVFDSQGHSSHGRRRRPEPGCGVLLGANAVQASGVHTHVARHRRTAEFPSKQQQQHQPPSQHQQPPSQYSLCMSVLGGRLRGLPVGSRTS
jgi:hypothetical protein